MHIDPREVGAGKLLVKAGLDKFRVARDRLALQQSEQGQHRARILNQAIENIERELEGV